VPARCSFSLKRAITERKIKIKIGKRKSGREWQQPSELIRDIKCSLFCFFSGAEDKMKNKI
jgi:hypothetical protein